MAVVIWMSNSYIFEASDTITTTDKIYISAFSDKMLTSLHFLEGTLTQESEQGCIVLYRC